uniref:Uncharacterized protein n=1 Tax=Tolypiocladia glomerulata TaxID=860646 RepID=A0A1Z1MUA7_9FLOR|nr:hypothetical protein [Tolypiocladia glomerulata]ARW69690.1 hypothetical protein [Tolypiocladia glomerulata]
MSNFLVTHWIFDFLIGLHSFLLELVILFHVYTQFC